MLYLKKNPIFSMSKMGFFWSTNSNYCTITFLAEAASSLIKYT